MKVSASLRGISLGKEGSGNTNILESGNVLEVLVQSYFNSLEKDLYQGKAIIISGDGQATNYEKI